VSGILKNSAVDLKNKYRTHAIIARFWILTINKDRIVWKGPWKQRNGLQKWGNKYTSQISFQKADSSAFLENSEWIPKASSFTSWKPSKFQEQIARGNIGSSTSYVIKAKNVQVFFGHYFYEVERGPWKSTK
jgi:hypothetical protein